MIGPVFRERVRALRRSEGRLLAVCRPQLARLDDYDAIALPYLLDVSGPAG
jgi:hypothetical protein